MMEVKYIELTMEDVEKATDELIDLEEKNELFERQLMASFLLLNDGD